MGSEGQTGGGCECLGLCGRLRGIGRRCGPRVRLADRHFTFCRGGGGSRGEDFFFHKVREPARGRREARRRSRAAAASRESGGRNGRGRRGRSRPFSGNAAARRGLGRRAGARRGLPLGKGRPALPFPSVPRGPPRPRLPRAAAVSAFGHLMRFIHAQPCPAWPGAGRFSAPGFPSTVFFSRLLPFLSPAYLLPWFLTRPRRLSPGTRKYM